MVQKEEEEEVNTLSKQLNYKGVFYTMKLERNLYAENALSIFDNLITIFIQLSFNLIILYFTNDNKINIIKYLLYLIMQFKFNYHFYIMLNIGTIKYFKSLFFQYTNLKNFKMCTNNGKLGVVNLNTSVITKYDNVKNKNLIFNDIDIMINDYNGLITQTENNMLHYNKLDEININKISKEIDEGHKVITKVFNLKNKQKWYQFNQTIYDIIMRFIFVLINIFIAVFYSYSLFNVIDIDKMYVILWTILTTVTNLISLYVFVKNEKHKIYIGYTIL
jgi:hypothetical protein